MLHAIRQSRQSSDTFPPALLVFIQSPIDHAMVWQRNGLRSGANWRCFSERIPEEYHSHRTLSSIIAQYCASVERCQIAIDDPIRGTTSLGSYVQRSANFQVLYSVSYSRKYGIRSTRDMSPCVEMLRPQGLTGFAGWRNFHRQSMLNEGKEKLTTPPSGVFNPRPWTAPSYCS
jgi:hypothetical protein